MIGGKPNTNTARALAWFESNGPATIAQMSQGMGVPLPQAASSTPICRARAGWCAVARALSTDRREFLRVCGP